MYVLNVLTELCNLILFSRSTLMSNLSLNLLECLHIIYYNHCCISFNKHCSNFNSVQAASSLSCDKSKRDGFIMIVKMKSNKVATSYTRF